MITDERVFDDDYAPRTLLYREGSIEILRQALEPAAHGERADDVLISGPSGVGKTALSKHVVTRVHEYSGLRWTHLRTLGETTGSILRSTLEAYPGAPGVGATVANDELPNMLSSNVDAPYVVILDEADDLCYDDALDTLLDCPYLSVIIVCHDHERWLAACSDRVRDSLATTVSLDRYSTLELADILERRAENGLASGVWTTEQLRTIADEVAGVAREGIQSLRAAAELATERGHSSILGADIADAPDRARRLIRESNLSSLPTHHQVLYALIYAEGPLDAGTLHQRYNELADELYADSPREPVGERTRRDKLSKLASYDLVEIDGATKGRSYSVVDGAVSPELDLGPW